MTDVADSIQSANNFNSLSAEEKNLLREAGTTASRLGAVAFVYKAGMHQHEIKSDLLTDPLYTLKNAFEPVRLKFEAKREIAKLDRNAPVSLAFRKAVYADVGMKLHDTHETPAYETALKIARKAGVSL